MKIYYNKQTLQRKNWLQQQQKIMYYFIRLFKQKTWNKEYTGWELKNKKPQLISIIDSFRLKLLKQRTTQ